MRLVSTEFGQVLQLLAMEELRPIFPAPSIFPVDFYRAVAERYRFSTIPTDVEEASRSGAQFEVGEIKIDDFTISVGTLGLYSDGIFVTTRDTRSSDLVVDDFLRWTSEAFQFRNPEYVPRRQYASAVIVEFSSSVDRAMGMFGSVGGRFSRALNHQYGDERSVFASRINFATDPSLAGNSMPTREFGLERRNGVPFAQNRWYSSAPLPTETHLNLLESFESDLSNL